MNAAIDNLIRLNLAIKARQWQVALTELVDGWEAVTKEANWNTARLLTLLAEAFLSAPDTSSECLMLAAARSNCANLEVQLARIVDLVVDSQQKLNPTNDPQYRWRFHSILLRARTIQHFRGDLQTNELKDELHLLLLEYRRLWRTAVWEKIDEPPSGRPAAWKRLASINLRLAESLDEVVQETWQGWYDPSAVFLCDTLLSLNHPKEDGIEPIFPVADGVGVTWILLAVDDRLKVNPEPDGLVLCFKIEIIPDGCGMLYPHPSATAHVIPSKSFQIALRNAWSVILGTMHRRHNAASNGKQCDYRWSLTVMDDSTECSLKEMPEFGQLDPDVSLHRHRRRLILNHVDGRSGEVAIACALRSAKTGIPIDQYCAVSAKFTGSLPKTENPPLKPVNGLLQKSIGIDNLSRRSKTLTRIDQLIVAASQTIPGSLPSWLNRLNAADFNDSFDQLSRHAYITNTFRKMQATAAENWFNTECFGLKSYVPNAMCWSHDSIRLLERPSSDTTLSDNERNSILNGRLHAFKLRETELRDFSLPHVVLRIVAESGMGKSTLLAWCEWTVNSGADSRIAVRVEHLIDLLDVKSADEFRGRVFDDRFHENLRHAFRSVYPDQILPDDAEISGWVKRKAERGEVVWLLDALDQMSDHRSNIRRFVNAFPLCDVLLTMRPESLADFAKDMAGDGIFWLTTYLQRFSACDARTYLGQRAYKFLENRLPKTDQGLADDHHVLAIPLLLRLLRDLIEGRETDDLEKLPQLKNRYSIYDAVMHAEGGLLDKGWISLKEREPSVRETFSSFRDVLECTQQAAFEQVRLHQFDTRLQGEEFQVVRKRIEQHYGKSALPAVEQIDILGRLRPVFDDVGAIHTGANRRIKIRTHLDLTMDGLKWRHRSFLEFHAGCRLAELLVSRDPAEREVANTQLLDIHSLVDSRQPDQTRTDLDSASVDNFRCRDLPVDWRDTLRFALSHLDGDERDHLARCLLQLGNFDVVQSVATQDRVEFGSGILQFAAWMRSSFACEQKDAPELLMSLLQNVDLNKLLNRGTRKVEWLWPLRRIVPANHQIYVASSEDQLLRDRLTCLHSGDVEWNFLQSFAELKAGSLCLNILGEHKRIRTQQRNIKPFALACFPVTNEIFELFCPAHRRKRDQYSSADDQPVVHVSWFEAREFCEWLSVLMSTTYRLPNEWEWVWASSWQNTFREPFWFDTGTKGDAALQAHATGYFGTRRRIDTIRAVQESGWQHPSSFAGPELLDLAGNVWEWCDNPWDEREDPTESRSSRVLRGGSWSSFAVNCLTAHRASFTPGNGDCSSGFRVCRG
ncbi:MAG: SUMF1/EgtB/PvdO family nonheme iron enzyme [Planctomycetaceae bacterium]|nr:SUMF1/EgtB/PvdO family nonheme iron enzyme [Planctomycetaceae bacterium]